jgi:aldose 1-epimerase
MVFGSQRAVITGLGASLRTYEVDGWPVVDGYAVDEMASGGRGQLLIPWPNRIGDGRYQFRGADYQLALSEPSKHNASHGLVRWSPWALEQPGRDRVVGRHHLYPQPGYPFSLELEVDYQLSDAGLRVQLAATNAGPTPAPYGAGHHPYLSVGTAVIDDTVLQLPAATVIPTDDRGLPRGAPVPVAGTEVDFRHPRRIGSTVLDVCYGDLERDNDGVVQVVLSHPSQPRTVTVWGDSTIAHFMVFSGDTLAPDRRRRSLAVEPMTCPPDAFRSGTGVVALEPGQQATTCWGIRAESPAVG